MGKVRALALLLLAGSARAGPVIIESPGMVGDATQVMAPEFESAVQGVVLEYLPETIPQNIATGIEDLTLRVRALRGASQVETDPARKKAMAFVLVAVSRHPAEASALSSVAGASPRLADALSKRAERLSWAAGLDPELSSVLSAIREDYYLTVVAVSKPAAPVRPLKTDPHLYGAWEDKAISSAMNQGGSKQLSEILAESSKEIGPESASKMAKYVLEESFPEAPMVVSDGALARARYASRHIATMYAANGWGERPHEQEVFRELVRRATAVQPPRFERSNWKAWGTKGDEPLQRIDLDLAGLQAVASALTGRPSLAKAVPESVPYLVQGLGRVERILDAHASNSFKGWEQPGRDRVRAKMKKALSALSAALDAVQAIRRDAPQALTPGLSEVVDVRLRWLQAHGSANRGLRAKAAAMLAKNQPAPEAKQKISSVQAFGYSLAAAAGFTISILATIGAIALVRGHEGLLAGVFVLLALMGGLIVGALPFIYVTRRVHAILGAHPKNTAPSREIVNPAAETLAAPAAEPTGPELQNRGFVARNDEERSEWLRKCDAVGRAFMLDGFRMVQRWELGGRSVALVILGLPAYILLNSGEKIPTAMGVIFAVCSALLVLDGIRGRRHWKASLERYLRETRASEPDYRAALEELNREFNADQTDHSTLAKLRVPQVQTRVADPAQEEAEVQAAAEGESDEPKPEKRGVRS